MDDSSEPSTSRRRSRSSVDVAIELVEARLRLLQQQVGASLRLPDDHLRLVLRRVLDLVGQPLRGQERVAQVVLALAVLVEQRLHARQVLAEPIDFAERVLVIVGRFGQERDDLGLVEAAHRPP